MRMRDNSGPPHSYLRTCPCLSRSPVPPLPRHVDPSLSQHVYFCLIDNASRGHVVCIEIT